MALIVYITDDCYTEAKNHGLQDTLEKVKTQLEADQDTRRLEGFSGQYWMKKQFGRRQGRLVIVEHILIIDEQEHHVFVCLAVIQRGDKSYDELSDNILVHGERLQHDRLKGVDLTAYAQQRLHTNEIIEKASLSELESAYLYSIHQHEEQHEETIYESISWFNALQKNEIKQAATRIFDTLGHVTKYPEQGGTWLAVERSAGYAILVRYFPHSGFWFLAGIVSDNNDEQKKSLETQYQSVLSADDDKSAALATLILQHSRKAYSALLSAEETIWKNLEFDAVGNLALSPEESDVLALAKDIQSPFPLFINGRAGSGKSTVLQYLFADYLYFYLSNKESAPSPAYFSCSSELIKRAAEVVASLLECGGKYWQDSRRQQIVKDNRYYFDKAFMEFRRFLHSHVPDNQQELFSLRNHVDYARFRQHWDRQFKHDPAAKSKYASDVSWHVIRSYIKGSSSDDFLDPEDYQAIEQKQQSVSYETFKIVYEKVWEWYKDLCHKEKLWDDQDLARLVLKDNLVHPQFPAIFCDESQDFTRLELEVILRLSLFSNKKIAQHQIRRIPFVFAGDQFQTLNPTGFRWEATKAQFVEKFIFALDANSPNRNTDMNYRELSHNFRSAPPIVRFSNVVQALRALLFRLNSLKPQIAWSLENSNNAVMRFAINNQEVWRTLKSFKDIVFIVPCLENEETDYIKNHRFLKNHIRIEEDGSTSIPVLSASRAKGLEFNRVVVLGFGENCPKPLADILQHHHDNDESMESDLSLQYFLNRLYVAVTRAKRQLIILDSDDGLQKFWQYFSNPTTSLQLQNLRHAREEWLKHMGHLEDLPIESLTATPENEGNAQENANEFARNGRENQDAYLLRQAGSLYRQIEQEIDSWVCFAEAEELDKQFSKAGKLYAQAAQYQRAFQCYWRGKHWAELTHLGKEHAPLRGRLEYRFAELIRNKQNKDDVLFDVFIALSKQLKQAIVEADEDITAWHYVCETLLNHLVKSKSSLRWLELSQALNTLANQTAFQRIILVRHRAEVAFKAQNYQAARQLWESNNDSKPNNYYIAVAETDPFPKNITALYKLKRVDTVLEQYEKFANKTQLKTEHWQVIAEILLKKEHYNDLLSILVEIQNTDTLLDVRRVAQRVKHPELLLRCRTAEIAQLIAHEQWQDVLKILQAKDEKQNILLVKALMQALARSDAYTNLSNKDVDSTNRPIRDQLSEIIRKHYLGTKDDKTPLNHIVEAELFEVGAALERTRRYIDGLNYYEGMLQRFPLKKRELLARWLACKERQVRHYEELARKHDNPDERLVNKELAEQNHNRALRVRHEIDLSSTDIIEEWPNLSSLDELIKDCLIGTYSLSVTKMAQITVATTVPIAQVNEAISPVAVKKAVVLIPHVEVTLTPTAPIMTEDTNPVIHNIAVEDTQTKAVDTLPTLVLSDNLAAEAVSRTPIWKPSVGRIQDKVEFILGDFKITLIRKSQRINIEHTETGDITVIKEGGAAITSDGTIKRDDNGFITYLDNTYLWLDNSRYAGEKILRLGESQLGLVLEMDLSKGAS